MSSNNNSKGIFNENNSQNPRGRDTTTVTRGILNESTHSNSSKKVSPGNKPLSNK